MTKGICSVCSAPRHMLLAVNEELRKPKAERMFLENIAIATGFSQSALQRHSAKHLPKFVAGKMRRVFNPSTDRIFVRWKGQPVCDPDGFPVTHFREGDCVVTCSFEDPLIKLMPDEKIRALPVSRSLVEYALEENKKRDRALEKAAEQVPVTVEVTED